jgi:hypothetical protein
MEAGTHSIRVSEQLQEMGHEVIVVNVRNPSVRHSLPWDTVNVRSPSTSLAGSRSA